MPAPLKAPLAAFVNVPAAARHAVLVLTEVLAQFVVEHGIQQEFLFQANRLHHHVNSHHRICRVRCLKRARIATHSAPRSRGCMELPQGSEQGRICVSCGSGFRGINSGIAYPGFCCTGGGDRTAGGDGFIEPEWRHRGLCRWAIHMDARLEARLRLGNRNLFCMLAPFAAVAVAPVDAD